MYSIIKNKKQLLHTLWSGPPPGSTFEAEPGTGTMKHSVVTAFCPYNLKQKKPFAISTCTDLWAVDLGQKNMFSDFTNKSNIAGEN